MSVAAVIPFRAGSHGLPGKNTRLVAGRRLWHWSWLAALRAKTVGLVIVTTDDEGTLSRAAGSGKMKKTVFVRRPPDLADADAPLDAAILHAIDVVGFDGTVVTLQPTVPVRREGLVDDCVRMFHRFPASGSLVTVNRLHFVWDIGGRQVNGPRVNRQDMTEEQHLFHEDGSVFVTDSAVLRETGRRVVEPVLLYETARTVDIDDEADLRLATALLSGDRSVAR